MAEKATKLCDHCGNEPAQCFVRISWQTWETAHLCRNCADKQKPKSIESFNKYYNGLPEIEKVRLDQPIGE